MIRGSDGWDYETVADRLIGEKAESAHNKVLKMMLDRGYEPAMSAEWAECYSTAVLQDLRDAQARVVTRMATVDAKVTMFLSREIEKTDRAIQAMKR